MLNSRSERIKFASKLSLLLLKSRTVNIIKKNKREEVFIYGNKLITVKLPKQTKIILPPRPIPRLRNPLPRLEEIIKNPLGMKPLSNLVNKNSRVTIAFDDPCVPVPAMKKPDVREFIISFLLRKLSQLGVAEKNITLLCANGLHRKWTREELARIIGRIAYGPFKLICHDGEDQDNLIYLGKTEDGHDVEINRLAADSDLLIYVNVNMTSMNGGWKSVCVGLGSYRSIRHHHSPQIFGASESILNPEAKFHHTLKKMGKVIEDKIGRKIFSIETVLNFWFPYRIAGIYGGYIADVHEQTLNHLFRQQNLAHDKQYDILIYGLPDLSPYATCSEMNPLLVYNLALGYIFQSHLDKPLVKRDGILITAHPCENHFHQMHHSSYREFYENVLTQTKDPLVMRENYEEDFALNKEYINNYRNRYSYHGAHPFFLWHSCEYARQYLDRIFLAGAKDKEVIKRLGLEWASSVEEAIEEALKIKGKDASLVYMPIPVAVEIH